jgi:sec-independent protein translocase protein TatA
MFGSLGWPEILIIGLVLVLLFGVGKISGLGKEIGGSIKEFRKAVKDEDDKDKTAQVQQSTTTQAAPPPPPQAQAPQQPPAETKKPNLF